VTEARVTSGPFALEILGAGGWQMLACERAALEGLLNQLKPELAIEIGTARGGSLRCLARHSAEVHSFDLEHPGDLRELENVTLHSGDSHELLPALLADLQGAGRNVDFVLVDGDHAAAGVARDVDALLSSGALRSTVILAHDAANDEVRAGLDAVEYDAYGKVAMVDLDFLAGHLSSGGPYANQLWGGFGLIVVVEHVPAPPIVGRSDTYSAFELFRMARERLLESPWKP
jgi:hypothetical protein